MKNNFLHIFSTLVIISTVSGCDRAGKINNEESEMNTNHRNHEHAFTDPDKLSLKWNNPERDQWQFPEEIIAALDIGSGDVVADIGAGTGYMVAHLSKFVGAEGEIIAIDAEEAMIEFLKQHSTDFGPAKLSPHKVGFENPDLNTSSVDAVLTLDTWHHVDRRESYAAKIYDGLKPGGRFAVVDYEVDADFGPPKEMRLSPDEVVRQLEAAGFRAEIMSESMPRHYLVIGHKE